MIILFSIACQFFYVIINSVHYQTTLCSRLYFQGKLAELCFFLLMA